MCAKVLMSYYDLLGVDRGADDKIIRSAHRAKAEIYHPDKVFHLGDKERKAAEMEMKLINNARDILLDPEQRALYDQYLDGALEAEEVLEAFIIVEAEMEEERSPLWKKVAKTFGQRWEDLRKATEAEEVLEAEEVIEVEPIADGEGEKKFDVIDIKPLTSDDIEPKKKTSKKKKKKGKPFEVVGVVEDDEPVDIDEDFLE